MTATQTTQEFRCLFFSTVFPYQMQTFCSWQEKAPLNQTGSRRMQYIPLLFYCFRWNIEVSYYDQKTFWSLCSYIVRSSRGIEILVTLINIAYCAMKILPYQEEAFSKIPRRKYIEIPVRPQLRNPPAGILCHFPAKPRNRHKIKCFYEGLETATPALMQPLTKVVKWCIKTILLLNNSWHGTYPIKNLEMYYN